MKAIPAALRWLRKWKPWVEGLTRPPVLQNWSFALATQLHSLGKSWRKGANNVMTQPTSIRPATLVNPSVYQLGFWTASFTALTAVVALGTAVTTPPRSGPFCTLAMSDVCVTYPYTAVAAYVPRDYIWMVPALLMVLLFLSLVVCIHYAAAMEKKVFSQIALNFATIAVAALAVDYAIQLTVMQPSLLKGEEAELSLFSQYNPHGIFIALENIGYLLMGVSFLFLVPVFDGGGGLGRAIRLLLLGCGLLALGAFLVLVLRYGYDLEYRYEVAAILIDWVALIGGGVLLSLFFRRAKGSGATMAY